MAFQPSTYYQAFARALRFSWAGVKGRAFLGGIGKIVGDMTIDWATQANLEHLPEYASSPSIGLTGSERQLIRGPQETDASYATRETYGVQQWKLAGTPIGILVALYYAGFQNAVLVQQNGSAYQLTAPPSLPDIAALVQPPFIAPSWYAATTLDSLANVLPPSGAGVKTIPAGQPWWLFDLNTDFASRFAVLFPGPLPTYFRTHGTATFTNSSTAAVVWNNVFPTASYQVQPGITVITDGGAQVIVDADGTTQATTGITLRASDICNATVTVLAWQTGASANADLHPADLARLRAVISTWKPLSRTCVGIYAVPQGPMFDWPVATWGTYGNFIPSNAVAFAP